MSNTTVILSLLHEPPSPHNSAVRQFRHQPVLAWTLDRLARCAQVANTVILCWDDQRDAVTPLAKCARLFSKPRTPLPNLDAISAAQRWSDGWRGGLLATCHFDRGFHAPYVHEALHSEPETRNSELIALVDPAAGLVDPALLDQLITHAAGHSNYEFFFTQAAPGLCGVVLRPSLLDRLVKTGTHPGRLLSYSPDLPGRDPMTTDMCLAVPPAIARTTHRFTLDSDRQVLRLTSATADLNGHLATSDAEQLVAVLDAYPSPDSHPREVVLELTTRRAARPIFAPGTHLPLGRGDIPLDVVERTLEQLAGIDDLRLTLAGAGDPLLHPEFPKILDLIERLDIPAVHVETDLLDTPEGTPQWLASSRIDVVTLHLPAATAATYERVMGVDGLHGVLQNLKQLLTHRRALPLVVPTFTKCRENLDEMEPWYDHWLRVLGTAVITGPSAYAGQIPDHACADMSPPRRRPCARLNTRLTILSDGTIPSCEQDVLATQPQGHATAVGVAKTWQRHFPTLRSDHEKRPLCTTCKEWHRP